MGGAAVVESVRARVAVGLMVCGVAAVVAAAALVAGLAGGLAVFGLAAVAVSVLLGWR